MSALLGIVDFIVLLALVVLVPRTVWKELPRGAGSLILFVCVSLVTIVFAIISFSAYTGLVEVSSTLSRGIFLVVLLVMAALLGLSWAGKRAA